MLLKISNSFFGPVAYKLSCYHTGGSLRPGVGGWSKWVKQPTNVRCCCSLVVVASQGEKARRNAVSHRIALPGFPPSACGLATCGFPSALGRPGWATRSVASVVPLKVVCGCGWVGLRAWLAKTRGCSIISSQHRLANSLRSRYLYFYRDCQIGFPGEVYWLRSWYNRASDEHSIGVLFISASVSPLR